MFLVASAACRFADWLVTEGEMPANDLLTLKPPQLDEKVVEPLTDDQLKALLAACVAACAGTDLRDRRDAARVRVMVETGARAGEVAATLLSDLDLRAGTVIVRRGKGGKGRVVPFGPQTGQALDRYLRARRGHRLAGTHMLWVGDRGKALSYDALHKSLGERAAAAGVTGFHRTCAGTQPRTAGWRPGGPRAG